LIGAVPGSAVSEHLDRPIGQRIALPGHFAGLVALEAVRPLTSDNKDGFECRGPERRQEPLIKML
jgi:hypothetical protein